MLLGAQMLLVWGGAHWPDYVVSFEIFLKFTSRLLPDGWVELKISGCRCHFRAFQLELDNLGTKQFEIGSVVKKLQLFEVGQNSSKM